MEHEEQKPAEKVTCGADSSASNGYVEIWHPIGDKWVHITQSDKDGKRYYFTDGVYITEVELNNNGYVKT